MTNNNRVIVVSGNGVGKSYAIGLLILAFTLTNLDSTTLGTSGSYTQFRDTMWKPLAKVYKQTTRRKELPGRMYDGNPPRFKIDEDWYAKAVSPRDPGDLEGRHDDHVFIVIEEADKRYITDEHFDSAGSSVTDLNDRMVAVANPPDDETDVTYRKMQSERWETIKFSTFQAHNVLVDAGIINDEHIPGITDLLTVAADFEDWNNETWPRANEEYDGQWPGMPVIEDWLEEGEIERETAIEWLRPGYHVAKDIHERREDLDERWYKRRAGVIPPVSAETHRPIYREDVQAAVNQAYELSDVRHAIGVDIGRTGDSTAIVEIRELENRNKRALYLRSDDSSARTHGDNEAMIRAAIDNGPLAGMAAGDALGEGSGVCDQMSAEYAQFVRFNGSMKPVGRDSKEYKNRRTQALAMLGDFLADGGVVASDRLEKELFAAARAVQYKRRRSGGKDVYMATSKEKIKEQIGRSPDALDAAGMAVWADKEAHQQSTRTVAQNERKSISSTF